MALGFAFYYMYISLLMMSQCTCCGTFGAYWYYSQELLIIMIVIFLIGRFFHELLSFSASILLVRGFSLGMQKSLCAHADWPTQVYFSW